MSGYWNTINPKETKEIIQNERDCFQTRAAAAADLEAQGRFKRQNETRVTGAAPVTYPALPSGPWSEGDPGAPDPVTDQFGDVNEMEPVGSHVEIERSLQTASAVIGSHVAGDGEPVVGSDRLSTPNALPQSLVNTASSIGIGTSAIPKGNSTLAEPALSASAGTEATEAVTTPPPSVASTPPRKFRRRF
jgi:hypothetical protein